MIISLYTRLLLSLLILIIHHLLITIQWILWVCYQLMFLLVLVIILYQWVRIMYTLLRCLLISGSSEKTTADPFCKFTMVDNIFLLLPPDGQSNYRKCVTWFIIDYRYLKQRLHVNPINLTRKKLLEIECIVDECYREMLSE